MKKIVNMVVCTQRKGATYHATHTVYSPEFKAKIVIEVLEGARELEAIAADNQLNPNMVRKWKSEFLQKAGRAFEQPDKGTKEARRKERKREKENERLLRTVGQLTLERDFLQDCFRLTGKPVPSLDQKGK